MFYTFSQNNSGGVFDFDAKRGIGQYVIVEADTPADANYRAEQIGLYFNGCDDDGPDCPCCGDRWSEMYRGEKGDEVPSIYGTPITEPMRVFIRWAPDGEPEGYVHFADGRVEPFTRTATPDSEEAEVGR